MNEQISAAEGRLGRVVVIRLAPGADLLGGMQEACERYGIHNGVVISAIGSLACVRFCNVEALPEKKCGYGYGRVLALDDTMVYRSVYWIEGARDDDPRGGVLDASGFTVKPIVAPRLDRELAGDVADGVVVTGEPGGHDGVGADVRTRQVLGPRGDGTDVGMHRKDRLGPAFCSRERYSSGRRGAGACKRGTARVPPAGGPEACQGSI